MFNSLPFNLLMFAFERVMPQYNIPVTSNFRSERFTIEDPIEGAKIQITLQRTASWATYSQ